MAANLIPKKKSGKVKWDCEIRKLIRNNGVYQYIFPHHGALGGCTKPPGNLFEPKSKNPEA